jgi:hypothetical protein
MKEEKEEESFQGNCSDGGGLWRPREGRAQEGYLIAIRGVSYQYDSEFVPAQFFMCVCVCVYVWVCVRVCMCVCVCVRVCV